MTISEMIHEIPHGVSIPECFDSSRAIKALNNIPTVQAIPLDVALDIVHKTIYTFFDVADDDSEEPISAKDELLLKVNKSIGAKLKGYVNEC